MKDDSLSVVIPSRCEMFLSRTVEDIVKNVRGNTDVIVVLDGEWADPPLVDQPKVTIIHHSVSVGQRAATNNAVKLSKAKYVLKCDAHCSFDEGFDVKMMEEMQDNWTMVPVMRNLHVFDWVCKKCGDRRYQDVTPTSCPKCDNKTEFVRDVVWIAKTNPQSTSYCFDSEPHFQYFREFKARKEAKGNITETMSLQGSCFMLMRDKYWELSICDESFGSWGSQGIEVAVKTWLSGGRVVCNHNTWYAHMFRTKGGDFGFPYPQSGRQVAKAKKHARDVFFNNKWPLQKHPLSWLLEKFWPVPGWTDAQLADLKKGDPVIATMVSDDAPAQAPEQEEIKPIIQFVEPTKSVSSTPTKGVVYYTDNRCEEGVWRLAQEYLKQSCNGNRIISVSLAAIDFGDNIIYPLERSYLTMFKQILAGIEAIDSDIVFLAEHDVFYTKEHFDFTPSRQDIFYYNTNNWQVRASDGHSAYWDCKKVSQICGYRDLMLKHYTERVRRVALEGFTRRMGFEPGTHRRHARVDDTRSDVWRTSVPNLDIRHKFNLTSSRWSPSQFRNPCVNWTEANVRDLPGWGHLEIPIGKQ